MRRQLRRQPRLNRPLLDHRLNAPSCQPPTPRIRKHRPPGLRRNPLPLEIIRKSRGAGPTKNRIPLLIPLPSNKHRLIAKIQIRLIKTDQLAHPQPRRIHQLQKRAIPQRRPRPMLFVQKLRSLLLGQHLGKRPAPNRRLQNICDVPLHMPRRLEKLVERPQRAQLPSPSRRRTPELPKKRPQHRHRQSRTPVGQSRKLSQVRPIGANCIGRPPDRQRIQKLLNPHIQFALHPTSRRRSGPGRLCASILQRYNRARK